MSATVVSIFDFLNRRETKPAVRPEQQARERVTAELGDSVPHRLVCEARAHAVRSVIGGRPVDAAVRYAVAWALHADHGPEAA